jgi:hypothetical protein
MSDAIDIDALDPLGSGIDLDALDPLPSSTPTPAVSGIDLDTLDPPPNVDAYAGPEHEIGPASPELVRKVGIPAALQIGGALATSGMSLPVQAGINVLTGEAGRRIAGEEPWKKGGLIPFKDESGWLQDLLVPLAPLAVNTGVGISKSLAKPLLKVRAPELVEAAKDISKGWEELPKVEPSDVSARPILDKGLAQSSIDATKDVLGSPVKRGLESKIAELRDTAKRVDLFPKARNRLARFVAKSEKDIFSTPAEGIRGKLGVRTEMPLADRENVKLFQQGLKTAEEVGPHVVEAAGKADEFYTKLGDLAERWGLFEDAPRIKGFSGPNIFLPGAEVSSLAEETGLAHPGRRMMGFKERELPWTQGIHVADAREIMRQYGRSAPEKLAGAYVGGPVGASTSTGTQEYGRTFNELLNRAGAQALDAPERARMESLIGSLKEIYHAGEASKATGVAQAVSTPLLSLSGLRQFKQAAWNVAKPGWQNFVEGATDYIRDPDVRALLKEGGGGQGSLSHLFSQMTPEESLLGSYARLGASKLPSKIGEPLKRAIDYPATTRLEALFPKNVIGGTIGASEGQLRSGILSAGYLPYTEKLIQRAIEAGAPGGRMTRGLSRELAEAGIDAADPRMGMLTHPNLTGRYQLMSGDPGQSSARLTGSEGGRLLGMFQNFPLGAARLFKSDIVDPMASGVRHGLMHGDASELALGAGRLTRYIPAGLAAGAAVAVGENLAKGRLNPADWAFDHVGEDMVSTLTGKFGDLYYGVNSARDKETGELDVPSGLLRAFTSQVPPIARVGNRPTWGQLGYHAATLLHPQAGSALSLFKPAIDEYVRRKKQEEEEFQAAISGR